MSHRGVVGAPPGEGWDPTIGGRTKVNAVWILHVLTTTTGCRWRIRNGGVKTAAWRAFAPGHKEVTGRPALQNTTERLNVTQRARERGQGDKTVVATEG